MSKPPSAETQNRTLRRDLKTVQAKVINEYELRIAAEKRAEAYKKAAADWEARFDKLLAGLGKKEAADD